MCRMAIDPAELGGLQRDFVSLRHEPCPDFFCPILLEHGTGPQGLMNGHILNEAIREAPRATVIQRADVDGHFGRTVEPDLIDLVNLNHYTNEEFLHKAGRSRTLRAV